MKLTVVIVDDHTLFREGLSFLLSNSEFIAEIHEAENGFDFLEKIKTITPDIVLMDIEMPKLNGIETTRKTLNVFPNCKIIALSMYGNENYYSQMIDAGAKGFLLKNSKFEIVEKAILEVYQGNNYFSPEILTAIIQNLNKKNQKIKNNDLTEREVEVLYQICKGFSNQEIAEILFISKRTVDKHRENILLKTQCKNTAEMVIFAIKNGYFEV